MLAAHRGKRDGEGIELRIAEHDQRPQEVAPAGEEGEQRQRDDDRRQQRQDDADEDARLARAVDARRVEHLVGQRKQRLADEQHRVQTGKPRRENPSVGVDQPEPLEQQEQRQHRHLPRHDDEREQRAEQRGAAAKAQLGEGITRGHRHQQAKQRRQRGQRDAVHQRAGDVIVG